MKHRVTAQVDIGVIKQNYNYIKKLVGNSRVMAVVKADAYGHGAEKIAKSLEAIGCNDFAVACLSEAQELREYGIKGNILILGPTDTAFIGEVIEGNFIQTVDSLEYASAIAKKGKVRVHVKVDTGMSRLGIYCHSNADVKASADSIAEIADNESLKIEGIFTHFADSDGESKDFTANQFGIFSALLDELDSRGISVGLRHCCNSAATLRYPEMHLDMVRAGIILYGLMPSESVSDSSILPAMKLSARVCAVHELKKGDCVSYGCTYKAERDTRIAVISIGYADGFSRVYSGKELISINGKRFATVGKICMDMCMVDIGLEFDCSVRDEAVIFESSADIEALASAMGSINYEILCSLKNRVRLKYINE
ncbi:MAG: alanine racemase [Clostridia bacterium]|nr:alanine racemase [Clostridia bacterium]MBQ9848578.1 alanine racemase [Clostridia bacterium]